MYAAISYCRYWQACRNFKFHWRRNMPDISLFLSTALEMLFEIFIAPGNLVVLIAAAITKVFSPVTAESALFALDGSLASAAAMFFWLILGLVIWRAYIYLRTAIGAARDWCRNFLREPLSRIYRYRIMLACKYNGSPGSSQAEGTIIQEQFELDDLAMTALQIASQTGANHNDTINKFRRSVAADEREIKKTLTTLQRLGFIKSLIDSDSYALTPAGAKYVTMLGN
jgi:hypothetical protein